MEISEVAEKASKYVTCIDFGEILCDNCKRHNDCDMEAGRVLGVNYYIAGHREATAEKDKEIERLKDALTPSAETKAAYLGEFSFAIHCMDEEGNEYEQNIYVPWTVIKKIMKAIEAKSAKKDHSGGNERKTDE